MTKLLLRILFLLFMFGKCEAQGIPIKAQINLYKDPYKDFGVYLAGTLLYRIPVSQWVNDGGTVYEIPSPVWLQRNQRFIQADVCTVVTCSTLSNERPLPNDPHLICLAPASSCVIQ